MVFGLLVFLKSTLQVHYLCNKMTIIRTKEATITWIIKHNIHVLNGFLYIVGLTAEFFAPCQGMQIPKSGKIWLVDSGIRNTAQGIRNLTNDWNPESKFY